MLKKIFVCLLAASVVSSFCITASAAPIGDDTDDTDETEVVSDTLNSEEDEFIDGDYEDYSVDGEIVDSLYIDVDEEDLDEELDEDADSEEDDAGEFVYDKKDFYESDMNSYVKFLSTLYVTFIVNDIDSKLVTSDPAYYFDGHEVGELIVVDSVSEERIVRPDGVYEFKGWLIRSETDRNGTVVQPGDKITIKDRDDYMLLYAIWVQEGEDEQIVINRLMQKEIGWAFEPGYFDEDGTHYTKIKGKWVEATIDDEDWEDDDFEDDEDWDDDDWSDDEDFLQMDIIYRYIDGDSGYTDNEDFEYTQSELHYGDLEGEYLEIMSPAYYVDKDNNEFGGWRACRIGENGVGEFSIVKPGDAISYTSETVKDGKIELVAIWLSEGETLKDVVNDDYEFKNEDGESIKVVQVDDKTAGVVRADYNINVEDFIFVYMDDDAKGIYIDDYTEDNRPCTVAPIDNIGDTIKLPEPSTYEANRYKFKGWYVETEEDDQYKYFTGAPGDVVDNSNVVTLFAIWGKEDQSLEDAAAERNLTMYANVLVSYILTPDNVEFDKWYWDYTFETIDMPVGVGVENKTFAGWLEFINYGDQVVATVMLPGSKCSVDSSMLDEVVEVRYIAIWVAEGEDINTAASNIFNEFVDENIFMSELYTFVELEVEDTEDTDDTEDIEDTEDTNDTDAKNNDDVTTVDEDKNNDTDNRGNTVIDNKNTVENNTDINLGYNTNRYDTIKVNDGVVKTGDNTPIAALALMSLISGLSIVLFRRKKKEEEE